MNINDLFSLDEHYNNILANNKDVILAGGHGDAFLANAKHDNRMALVILIRINSDIKQSINKCISALKIIEPDLYFYPDTNLHITVMDILKGEDGRKIPDNIDDYLTCIEQCLKNINAFNIVFNGLTLSDNAIMVKGYYENTLQIFRENLRYSLKNNNLINEERYKTISSHITIARLKNKYKNGIELIKFIQSYELCKTMKVNSFEVCLHNWYDTRKEIITTYKLWSK